MHRHRRGIRRQHQQRQQDITVDDAELRQSMQLTTVPDLMSAMTLFRVVEEPPSPQRSTGSSDTAKGKATEEKPTASPVSPLDPLPGLFELYRGRSDDDEDDTQSQQQVDGTKIESSPTNGEASALHRIRFPLGRAHAPVVGGAGGALGWFGRWTTKTSMSPNRPPMAVRRRTNGDGDDQDNDDEDDDDDDTDEEAEQQRDDTTVKANPGRGDDDGVDGAKNRKKQSAGGGGRQFRTKAIQAAATAASNAKKKTKGGKVRRRMNWRVAAMGGGASAATTAGASSSNRGGRRTPDYSDESSSVGGGARGVVSTTGSTTTSRSGRSFHTLFSTETPRLSNTTPPQFLEYDYTTEERSVHTEDLVKAGRLSGRNLRSGAGGAEAELVQNEDFVREWASSSAGDVREEPKESPRTASQSKESAGSPRSRKSSSSRLQSQTPSRLPISRYSPTEAMMRMRRDDPAEWSKEELYRQAQLILWGKDTPPSSTRGTFHNQDVPHNHDALTNAVLHGAAHGDRAMPDTSTSLPSDEGGDYHRQRETAAQELEAVFGVYSSQEQLAMGQQAAARGADIAAAADDVADLRGEGYDYDFETDEDEDELGVAAAKVAGVGRRNSRGVEFDMADDDAIGDVDHVAHLLSQSSSSDLEFGNDDEDEDGLSEFGENLMARRHTLGAGSLGHVEDDEPTQGMSTSSASSSDGTPIPAAPPATSEAWEMNRSPDMSTLTTASERKSMEGSLGDTEASPPAPTDTKRFPPPQVSPSSLSVVSPASLSTEDPENPPPPPPPPSAGPGVDAEGNPLKELSPPDFGVAPGSLSSLAAGSSLMLDKEEYRSAPSFSSRHSAASHHGSREVESIGSRSATSGDKTRRRRQLRRPQREDASQRSQDSASSKGSSTSGNGPAVLRPRRPHGQDFGGSHDRLAVSHSPGRSVSSSSTSSSKRRKSPAPVDLDDGRFVHAERHLRAIHDLAAEHLAHGEYEEALEVFEEILRGQQQRYGKKHPRIGTALHNIAIVHMRAKNYEAAVATCSKAVYVRRDALGDEHPDVAVSLAQLGIAHLECKEHRAALVSFREALRIRRKLLDRNHPKVAKILNNIGCCLFELNDLKGSMAAFEEALVIQRRMMRLVADGDDPADTPNTRKSSSSKSTAADANKILLSVAASLCNIGSIRLRRREYEESIVALEEALLIQQSVLGDDHSTVLNTLESIELVEMTKFEFTERHGDDQNRSRFGRLGEESEMPPSPTCSTSIPDSTPIMGACTTVSMVSSGGGGLRSSSLSGSGGTLHSFLPVSLMGGVGGGGGVVERRRRWYQRVVEDFTTMGAGTTANTEGSAGQKAFNSNPEASPPREGSFDAATRERLSIPDRSIHRGPTWM